MPGRASEFTADHGTHRGRPVRAGEGRLGGGRGSASTVLRATPKRSRRRAALRWGTGPDSTGSSRSEWLPHAEVRYIAVLSTAVESS